MSNVIVDKQKIDILANAIADKSGVPVTMTLDEMKEAVDGIDTSGIVPTGNINITQAGQTDVTNYATATVPKGTVYVSGNYNFYTQSGVKKWRYSPYAKIDMGDGLGTPGFIEDGAEFVGSNFVVNAIPANTTITPTESSQTVGGQAYMMEGAVTVNAIPSSYVGSGVTRRSSSDMTSSGATVTAPAGYYASSTSKTIPNAVIGSGYYLGTGARLSTYNGQLIMVKDDNDGTFLVNVDSDGYIAQGQPVVSTHSVQLRANCNINDSSSMTVSGATVTAPAGYYADAASKAVASGTVTAPASISGTSATVSTGTNTLTLTKTVSVTPVVSTAGYVSSGTAGDSSVSLTASVNTRSSSDLTVSGGTVTAPAGYYGSAASKSVSAIVLPISLTTQSVGTKKASILSSLTTQYLNIPTGYNADAQYYEVLPIDVGTKTITENGTYYAYMDGHDGFSSVTVNVSGGGGGGGTQIGTKTTTHGAASASISFTGLSGEPTSFVVISNGDLATGASPYKTAAVVWDGSSIHGQTITNTNNAQASYDGSGFSKSYSNGTLTITGTGAYFQNNEYTLVYSYGGTAASIDTADVQVGSGATSVTFTGLSDEPTAWSCIFKSNFSTSSGYQRVIAVVYDGSDTYGMEMDSSAHYSDTHWSYTYNNGSLTITSQGTNAGGYFHQPGYYQLTAVYGGEASPYQTINRTYTPTTSTQTEKIEPDTGYDAIGEVNVTVNPIPSQYVVPTGNLAITQNGNNINVSNYATVSVSVPTGGGASTVATTSVTNSTATNTSISFTNIPGRPIAFFVRCTASLARSSSSSYYYVADIAMRKVGSTETVVGNTFRMSNGTYSNITSGYSFSYSGTTLTVTSSGTRSASPGSFYNGAYELTYVY